jgi:hypothetical protein
LFFRWADGSFTWAFWYVAAIAVLMVAAGIWSLVAPESFRARNLKFLRKGLGLSSNAFVRVAGAVEIVLAVGFMTWVLFFTAPGVAY